MVTWTAPPAAEQFPSMVALDLADTARLVRGFIQERGGTVAPGSPIERWIEVLASAHGRSVTQGTDNDIDILATLGDVYGAALLAWSARVLQAAPSDAVSIDASLVSNELTRVDGVSPFATERGREMPGGVGSLYLAALLIHVGGGKVAVAGCRQPKVGVPKPDLLWAPPGGGQVTFERKDRAFFRSSSEDAASLAKTMLERSLGASSQMRATGTTIPVAVIGATARHSVAVDADRLIRQQIFAAWAAEESPPAALYVHFHGFDVDRASATAIAQMTRHFIPNPKHPAWLDPACTSAANALRTALG